MDRKPTSHCLLPVVISALTPLDDHFNECGFLDTAVENYSLASFPSSDFLSGAKYWSPSLVVAGQA
ncbi:hypothetical protein RvY_10017 [Ramazzottius varieornatus]|uniref:Uncharacterized protein n=1 Tax=Ramazzottius varieornatus TaxID=947166 RepID=A0A1D1VGP8_RAMVA|nr:hypothetical protein RvY_10017 [Ramazzottius varieornatus]